jgi:hypothetical protein
MLEMKLIMMAAALTLGGAAMAQETTETTTTTTTTMSTGSTVAPDNSAPELDARGIPVISAPATAPPGWNSAPGTGTAAPSGPAPSMGAATDLPPCTRTVTDHCVQTYERGRSPGA